MYCTRLQCIVHSEFQIAFKDVHANFLRNLAFCRYQLFCRCCAGSGDWRLRGGNGLHGVAEEKGDNCTQVHTAL